MWWFNISAPNWVLTAAHCVTNSNTGAVLNPNEITISAGITQREDLISGQYRNVAQIIRHPNYNSTTLENDVALIQLDVNFNFNTNVGPILLTDSETYASVGTMARVTGWGNIIGQQGQIILSNQLQTLELPIISRSLANNINTSNNTVTSTMVPLYQVGAGASQGDSGGPASIVKDNSRYLIGCSSWGEFPKDQKPTIYTDLYDFRNWISNIVPLPNLIGNNIICSTPNTTFTLDNENATSWQVSSNLQILNSSDTTITVKPNVSYTTTGWIKAIFSTGIFITKNINLNNPVININDISLMDENYNSINGSGTYDDPFIVCSNKSYILGGNSQLDMSDMNNITLPSGWSGYSYGAIQIFFTTGDFSGSQDNIIIDYEGVCGSSYHRVYFALNGDCSSGYYRYSIVPNPITTGQLNIISKNDKENKKGKQEAKTLVEFLVFDYQGIQLNSKKDNNNKTSYQLNVSHLKQGIYYLKIITESHSEVHKILIEQ